MDMEYSLFEKIEMLMENFESIDEVVLRMEKGSDKKSLLIKINEYYFPAKEVERLINEYFEGYPVSLRFFI